MNTILASRLMVLGAALLFSTGGAAIKATTLSGWQTAGLRSIVAAIALMALVPEARKGWSWRVWPVGLTYAATLVSYVLAIKLTTSANAIFLQSTAPAYLLLIGPLFLKESIHRRDIVFTVALVAGMTLFFTGVENPIATAPNPALGNIYGALSGAAYAFTLAGLRWLAHTPAARGGALATVVAGNTLAFVISMPMALPIHSISAADSAVLLYLGVLQIGLAYLLLTRGMKQVRAFEASTLLLLEPVCNPIFTWFFHGERPAARALAGGAVILVSTFVKLWHERREA
ncbi:EamA family transporter [uncultured Paludibaculum sp.]|uniref:DMT family transporter n=1 Tax=uncultured Paludibaculum sp. TaxID=1765020 RepID=UPI002AAB71DA|nr:EamA family transporter [uncultured Paludibaculum sp.]